MHRGRPNTNPRRPPRADRIGEASRASMSQSNPSRDDFAALLDESFSESHSARRLRRQGRHHGHREHGDHRRRPEGRRSRAAQGVRLQGQGTQARDTVEIYVERIENALGEAMLSRDKARREKAGFASRRSSTRASASKASSSTRSRAASRSTSTAPWPSSRARRSTSVRSATSRRSCTTRSPSRSSRWIAAAATSSCRAVRARGEPVPSSVRRSSRTSKRPGGRRRGQEHHRLRCVRRPRRHRRPAARHRHGLAPRQTIRPRSSTSVRRSRCRSSASTRKPTASRSA